MYFFYTTVLKTALLVSVKWSEVQTPQIWWNIWLRDLDKCCLNLTPTSREHEAVFNKRLVHWYTVCDSQVLCSAHPARGEQSGKGDETQEFSMSSYAWVHMHELICDQQVWNAAVSNLCTHFLICRRQITLTERPVLTLLHFTTYNTNYNESIWR